jgi:uncharacterized membrane protein
MLEKLMLNYVALFLIFFAIFVIVVGIVVVHKIPGNVATQRNHPQVEAIKITSYLGLLVFPLWMFALVWAYFRPWPSAGFDRSAQEAPDDDKDTAG